jgi:hypothetical protein
VAELGPELAPEAIGLAEALAVLGKLVVVLFALGCIYAVDHFVRALFSTVSATVGWIPFAGKVVRAPIHKIEQKVVDSLARAEQSLDSYIAHSWHQLAKLVRMLGREAEGLAHDYLAIVRFLDRLWGPKAIMVVLRAALHPIRALQQVEHRTLQWLRGEHTTLANSVAHGVYPRLKTVERTVAQPVTSDITALRTRTKALEKKVEAEFKWIRTKPWLVVSAAFAASVALALKRLGWNWIGCKNWKRIGKHVCGLPVGLIEELLTLAIGFLVVVDPVDIGKLAIKSEQLMHDFVVKIAEAND